MHPYVPTQGDVPTIGHGSTRYEDGRRVTLADPPITRKRAVELALGELDRTYAQCVRDSLGATLVNQTEFDQAADFAGSTAAALGVAPSCWLRPRQATIREHAVLTWATSS